VITLTNLRKHFSGKSQTRAVDGLDLTVPAGKLVTLLGPSGCGKTTTLRLIAGLERPDAGEIVIDGRTVFSSDRRGFVGAHQRPIGMVFQSYAIWPHMTVLANVMFPLREGHEKVSRPEARKRALAALELVHLSELADRPAPMLSGGQQQRVALARALVRQPKVLLLDEPLSNLDAGLRDRMREEIRALQQRLAITTILVTHDQEEALAVSDEIVLMNAGKIVERGLPQEIYAAPRSEFTARFLGLSNALSGVVRSVAADTVEVDLAAGTLRARRCEGAATGDKVTVFLRPDSFKLTRRQHSTSAWVGQVEFSIYRGDCWDYHVRVGDDLIKARVFQEKIGLSRGDQVYLEPDESGMVMPMAEGGPAGEPLDLSVPPQASVGTGADA
jgi:ABC-type Fe3+/spermidine/putrescine transport system ATPase subunit